MNAKLKEEHRDASQVLTGTIPTEHTTAGSLGGEVNEAIATLTELRKNYRLAGKYLEAKAIDHAIDLLRRL